MGKKQVFGIVATVAVVICMWAQPHRTFAQQASSRMFSSPSEAALALAQAVQHRDEPALEAILGAGRDVLSSGDESVDVLEREHFARKYDEMHRMVQEPDGITVLYVGAENWPFPIPLRSGDGGWFFDAKAGREEILYRKIGENETTAIETCRTANQTGAPELSRAGYRFRAKGAPSTVTKTSARATGNPANHKTLSGIALVAYPIEYRASGVMTFVVTQDGRVFEKDLGPDTGTLAARIDGRVSAKGWKAVN